MKFKKGSFVIVPNKDIALKLRGANLNVYMAICAYADTEGRCFPSNGVIEEKTGYSKRAVQLATEELERLGLLSKATQQREDGMQTTNLYQIVLVDDENPQEGVQPTARGGCNTQRGEDAKDCTPINSTNLTQPITNIDKSILGDSDKRNPEIQQIIDEFERIFEAKITKPHLNRFAAKRLIGRYGFTTVLAAVKLARTYHGQSFKPQIKNILDLEEKWLSLRAAYQRDTQEADVTKEIML